MGLINNSLTNNKVTRGIAVAAVCFIALKSCADSASPDVTYGAALTHNTVGVFWDMGAAIPDAVCDKAGQENCDSLSTSNGVGRALVKTGTGAVEIGNGIFNGALEQLKEDGVVIDGLSTTVKEEFNAEWCAQAKNSLGLPFYVFAAKIEADGIRPKCDKHCKGDGLTQPCLDY